MRYFLHKERAEEVEYRMEYLYEVFHLWFIKTNDCSSFFVFESFPSMSCDDIAIVYGHNFEIFLLFATKSKLIRERNIFIISCESIIKNGYRMPNKRTYMPPLIDGYTYLLDGKEYLFDFDITDVELRIYNSRIKCILDKLTSVFELIG